MQLSGMKSAWKVEQRNLFHCAEYYRQGVNVTFNYNV